ncbi:MAG: hypothetical protein DMG37_11465 [Acidobacteria bacterium]|nr:MAG: hypothetical protein DMG37_11465 [Acidobacteriota bacterium]
MVWVVALTPPIPPPFPRAKPARGKGASLFRSGCKRASEQIHLEAEAVLASQMTQSTDLRPRHAEAQTTNERAR